MAYEVTFLEIAGAQDTAGPKASIVYRFEILDGPRRTRAEVVLTYGGVEIIERGGKDPRPAASIALLRQKPERQFELGGNQREHVLFPSLV